MLIAACTPPKQKVLVEAPVSGWVSLFNGSNLDGWTPKIAGQAVNDNYHDTFKVENGLLTVSYGGYDQFNNRFGAIYYKQPFSHYWLKVEYRFAGGSLAAGAPRWAYKNSGIYLHSQAPQTMRLDQQFPVSAEFDLVGAWYLGSKPTGNVCQNGTHVLVDGQPLPKQCSALGDTTIRDDRWTTALAEVDGGRRVRQYVDGQLVVEYTDITLDEQNQDAARLLAAGASKPLTAGYIGLQSNGYPIQFRRIEVLPIDDSQSAAAH